MLDEKSLKMPFGITGFYRYLKTKVNKFRENPNYFTPDGLTIFVGPQGSGKTLSAVQYVKQILEKYPMCKLVTNIIIKDFPIVTYEEYCEENSLDPEDEKNIIIYQLYNRVFPFDNNDDFTKYNNGSYGIIFFIDEIQLYLNSLESKNINIETINVISQQRKGRKHIVATSQVFGRMAKPLREQFSNVIKCQCVAGCFQLNKYIDRDSIEESTDDSHIQGKVRHRYFWFHKYKYYDDYDTYYIIDRTKFISAEKKKGDIYAVNFELPNNN